MNKIFIDIINNNVQGTKLEKNLSSTYTHTQTYIKLLYLTYTHARKRGKIEKYEAFGIYFSLLIDFIAPINEFRISYNKNASKTILPTL